MNHTLIMAMGKPEHPGHVRGVRWGAAITSYFRAPRWHRNTITDDKVDILVESKLVKERELQEEAWTRREEALKASFKLQVEAMWREIQGKTQSSYPSQHHYHRPPQSGNESCMIEKELSSTLEVILYNLVIITGSFPLHTYMYIHVYNLVIFIGSLPVNWQHLSTMVNLTQVLYYLVATWWFSFGYFGHWQW